MPRARHPRRGSRSRAATDRLDLAVESSARNRRHDPGPRWPWPVVTVLSCLLGVLGVWVLLTGLVIPEWLALSEGDFGDLVGGSAQLWLLAQGVPLGALGLKVGLVPLGLTLLLLLVGERTCHYSARVMGAARRASGGSADLVDAVRLAALHASTQLAAVVLVAGAVPGHQPWGRVLIGGLTMGLATGLAGALRGARPAVAELIPDWARDLLAGASAGCAVALVGGIAALIAGLIAHGARVVELHESLGAGAWGGVVLLLLQLGWLPNLMIWWTSWTLGPGFAVGSATSVSPFGVHLGMVPSIPILGALPANGAPSDWVRLWLLVPIAAGAVAGMLVARRRRADPALPLLALTTASGVLAGLVLGLLGARSAGGIGQARMARMGAPTPAMLGMAVALLGGGALLAGAVRLLVTRLPAATSSTVRQAPDETEEQTRRIARQPDHPTSEQHG